MVFSWSAILVAKADTFPKQCCLKRIMDRIKDQSLRSFGSAMAERPLGLTKWRGITVLRDG